MSNLYRSNYRQAAGGSFGADDEANANAAALAEAMESERIRAPFHRPLAAPGRSDRGMVEVL